MTRDTEALEPVPPGHGEHQPVSHLVEPRCSCGRLLDPRPSKLRPSVYWHCSMHGIMKITVQP